MDKVYKRGILSLITVGNKKIGKDTLIFNTSTATHCPSETRGLCKVADICYAKRDETLYPSAYSLHSDQHFAWNGISAEDFAEVIQEKVHRQKTPIKYFRYNMAGDVSSQKDIDKIVKIAELIPEIIFYIYTCRADLGWVYAMETKNLIVNGSTLLYDNEFTTVTGILIGTKHACIMPVDKDEWEAPVKNTSIAVCNGDCRVCNLCKVKGGKIIYVVKH